MNEKAEIAQAINVNAEEACTLEAYASDSDGSHYQDSELCEVVRYRLGVATKSELDSVIQEVPIAIEYNGIAYTVMMGTPNDLEEFAIGFSFTSHIIEHHKDIHDIELLSSELGITLRIEIANRCVANLKKKRRSSLGVTGCGICGEEKLSSVHQLCPTLSFNHHYDISRLLYSLHQLDKNQKLNHKTGASHAATYFNTNGELVAIFEDVGRHIALDKLVGFIVRKQLSGGSVLVTSRASFEMVQKVASAGIECLFAMSAPTQMAITLAKKINLTLVGFCRDRRADVYSCPERITGELGG